MTAASHLAAMATQFTVEWEVLDGEYAINVESAARVGDPTWSHYAAWSALPELTQLELAISARYVLARLARKLDRVAGITAVDFEPDDGYGVGEMPGIQAIVAKSERKRLKQLVIDELTKILRHDQDDVRWAKKWDAASIPVPVVAPPAPPAPIEPPAPAATRPRLRSVKTS